MNVTRNVFTISDLSNWMDNKENDLKGYGLLMPDHPA